MADERPIEERLADRINAAVAARKRALVWKLALGALAVWLVLSD